MVRFTHTHSERACYLSNLTPPPCRPLTDSFNRIDLPPYTSYAMLESKMTTAIEETMGFGSE